MCRPNAAPPNATACVGADWKDHVVIYAGTPNPAPVLTDIARGQLPQVSWVIPSGASSDHAGNPRTNEGPSWVAAVVNAIGNSPYWENTAIIVTWDDWGGWYDHVPPFKIVNDGKSWGSGYVYGFRVPLIVISPYARASYISHVNHDFGSILHLIRRDIQPPFARLCGCIRRRSLRLFQFPAKTSNLSDHRGTAKRLPFHARSYRRYGSRRRLVARHSFCAIHHWTKTVNAVLLVLLPETAVTVVV